MTATERIVSATDRTPAAAPAEVAGFRPSTIARVLRARAERARERASDVSISPPLARAIAAYLERTAPATREPSEAAAPAWRGRTGA